MTAVLSESWTEFVESGVSILLGTRDAQLRPEVLRGMGAQVGKDRASLTIYVPTQIARATLDNASGNGQLAITFSRAIDHKTLQIKGVLTAARDTDATDHAIQERYLAGFVEQLYFVGVSRALSRRLRYRPSTALELTIRDVFLQTPGPGAGRRLAEGGAS